MTRKSIPIFLLPRCRHVFHATRASRLFRTLKIFGRQSACTFFTECQNCEASYNRVVYDESTTHPSERRYALKGGAELFSVKHLLGREPDIRPRPHTDQRQARNEGKRKPTSARHEQIVPETAKAPRREKEREQDGTRSARNQLSYRRQHATQRLCCMRFQPFHAGARAWAADNLAVRRMYVAYRRTWVAWFAGCPPPFK